nr:MAG TPA: hypothetical protein [Caudoviricetes sp.]
MAKCFLCHNDSSLIIRNLLFLQQDIVKSLLNLSPNLNMKKAKLLLLGSYLIYG